jgi:hypothetical protein
LEDNITRKMNLKCRILGHVPYWLKSCLNAAVRLGFPSAEKMSAFKEGPVCPELLIYRKFIRNPHKNKKRLKLTALSKVLVIINSFI